MLEGLSSFRSLFIDPKVTLHLWFESGFFGSSNIHVEPAGSIAQSLGKPRLHEHGGSVHLVEPLNPISAILAR